MHMCADCRLFDDRYDEGANYSRCSCPGDRTTEVRRRKGGRDTDAYWRTFHLRQYPAFCRPRSTFHKSPGELSYLRQPAIAKARRESETDRPVGGAREILRGKHAEMRRESEILNRDVDPAIDHVVGEQEDAVQRGSRKTPCPTEKRTNAGSYNTYQEAVSVPPPPPPRFFEPRVRSLTRRRRSTARVRSR